MQYKQIGTNSYVSQRLSASEIGSRAITFGDGRLDIFDSYVLGLGRGIERRPGASLLVRSDSHLMYVGTDMCEEAQVAGAQSCRGAPVSPRGQSSLSLSLT